MGGAQKKTWLEMVAGLGSGAGSGGYRPKTASRDGRLSDRFRAAATGRFWPLYPLEVPFICHIKRTIHCKAKATLSFSSLVSPHQICIVHCTPRLRAKRLRPNRKKDDVK